MIKHRLETALKKYSKPRGAGDQTSGGRGKLLRATTELTRVQILVRETLQNSWDAAEKGWIPAYGVHVRKVSTDVARLMAESVFTDLGAELENLAESLASEGLHVMEIYDRGTSGLNGPTRATVAAQHGEPNNFNAFVFDIGSTKPVGSSGGTFGFGKTATFEVSRPHAVVYWTRCNRGDGVLEDRLIASALHDPYDVEGRRFTGAHWWGDPGSSDIVPLRGDEATRLGEMLFETPFVEDETGTSILVIDPMVTVPVEGGAEERVEVRTEPQARQLGSQVIEAILTSAWPKLVPYANGETPMILEFDVYGEAVDIPRLVQERFQVLGHGLASIREEQAGEGWGTSWERPPEILDEELSTITLRPPKSLGWNHNIAGHVYFARVIRNPLQDEIEWKRINQRCFMRSDAELVVWYEPLVDDDDGMFQWFGVFKPTHESDRHFAASEPSTHDAWNKNAPEDPASTYIVERTLSQVRRKARDFMSRYQVISSAEVRSARRVAQSLASFVPVASPHNETNPTTSNVRRARKGGTTGARHELTIGSTTMDELGNWTVDFNLDGEQGTRLQLEARVQAVTFDGGMDLQEEEIRIEWMIDGTRTQGRTVEVAGGVHGRVSLASAVESTLSFDISVKEPV